MTRLVGQYYVMEYWDGIQIFVGLTKVKQRYICMLVEQGKDSDLFLCAPISQLQIQKHVTHEYDLRDMFTTPRPSELYTLRISDYTKTIYEMEPFMVDPVPEKMLPLAGYRFKGAGVLGRYKDKLHKALDAWLNDTSEGQP